MGLYENSRRRKQPQGMGTRRQRALGMKMGVVAGALIVASVVLTSEAVGNTVKWIWESINTEDEPRVHTVRTLPEDDPWTPPKTHKIPRYQMVKGKPIRECLKPGNKIDQDVVTRCWKDHLEAID